MASCWRSAFSIAPGCRSQSWVEPSMSVKRKVTVPLGNSGMAASCRDDTQRREGQGGLPTLARLDAEARIEEFAQPVANGVDGEHGEHDGEAGEGVDPPVAGDDL